MSADFLKKRWKVEHSRWNGVLEHPFLGVSSTSANIILYECMSRSAKRGRYYSKREAAVFFCTRRTALAPALLADCCVRYAYLPASTTGTASCTCDWASRQSVGVRISLTSRYAAGGSGQDCLPL